MTMRTFYVILVSAVCTLTLRALPFVLFRKDKAILFSANAVWDGRSVYYRAV